MANFNANPYYNPSECGLELITTVEEDEAYQFAIVAVWRDLATNKFYYASDSGCSCPTPFESYNELGSLNPLNEQTWDEFRSHVRDFCSYRYTISSQAKSNFLARVKYHYDKCPAKA